MYRRFSLAIVALLAAAACQVVPPDVAKQIAPDRTDYKTLEAAYHVLLERHVDVPTPSKLLNGALDGADEYLAKAANEKGAGCAGITSQRPTFTESTESDLVKASAALDGALKACSTADKVQIQRAATDGMAKALAECHTYYLDPDRAKEFNQPPKPYSGIGATILAPNEKGGMAEISSVFPNSPAAKAGVRPGDRIKEVNGKNVTGLTPEEIANRIKGPEATQVQLVLVRGTQELTLAITRATLTPPRVTQQAFDSGKIVLVSVSQLNGDVAQQTQDAVRAAMAAGAKGIILDLRNDPGGDLSAAVNIAGIFVKNADLVDQVGREGKKEQVRTDDRWYVGFNGPVVVMVNSRSASGAEIIAAGLRANNVATVVGERSAGCVGIAQPREMPDGGLLLVTLARMEDPRTGEPLNGQGRGVAPDVVATDDPNTPDPEDVGTAVSVLEQKLAARPAGSGSP